jgi:hypothetical protein
LVGRVAWPSLLVKCTVPVYPAAVFPNASFAVTVVLNDVPAVAVEGANTRSTLAAALTVTLELPVIELIVLSVAVIDCEPIVFNVVAKT